MPESSRVTRRALVQQSSTALALPGMLFAAPEQRNPFMKIADGPDSVTAFDESRSIALQRSSSRWQGQDIEVRVLPDGSQAAIAVQAPKSVLRRIRLRWQIALPSDLQYLGDQWERSYGDLSWRGMEPERILPWYFIATNGKGAHACGVKTGPAAFCFWQVDPSGVSLWLDLRNGGRGVQLGDRDLAVASIVTESYQGITPFAATARFCRRMCEAPRLPAGPVYGGNNWYYAYGKSSAEEIRQDSERIASLASPTENKPFMVIDDGWSLNRTAGPWLRGNSQFPDMAGLARDMRRIGVQPGLWMRPLFTKQQIDPGWQLQSPNAQRQYSRERAYTLDPTIPEVLEAIRRDVRTLAGWGYGLIKHDFSTYDLLGRWGFAMGAQLTDDNWNFANRNRTNAEVILDLYRAIREAAGDVMLLGCNTVGHLAAGVFELQRIGDDTSGRDWNRTRKMGINTLAFRGPQHNAFFAVDADCVGITRQISWVSNRQWLDLLAKSGTPLFVSAAPDAVGPEQRDAVREAFKTASTPRPLGEPLDWLTNSEPERWSLQGSRAKYDWFGSEGASPLAE
jgi:alpha-galactosidase